MDAPPAPRTHAARRDNPNQAFVEHLASIADLYQMTRQDPEWEGKKYGYLKAIRAINAIDYPLTSSTDAIQYHHIGPKTASKVEEFTQTGTTQRFEQLKASLGTGSESIDLFMQIHGVGPVRALQLYTAGRRTLQDIVPEDLNAAQRIGLKYFDDFLQRIPRDEIQMLESVLLAAARREDYTVTVAGSYRRGRPDSGDVDVIATGITLPALLTSMYHAGVDLEKITQGAKKYSGVAITHRHHRNIDIRVFRPEEYATALLHSTGSDKFNTLMRLRAIDLGMKLNEYGLFYFDGDAADIRSEPDVFTALDVEYLAPRDRDNVSELHTGNLYTAVL